MASLRLILLAVPALGRRGLNVLLIPCLALTGCLQIPKSEPKVEVKSLQSSTNETSITPTVVQARAMRFADDYSMAVAQAADDFAARIGTFEARLVAVRIKLGQANAAVINAAGANPTVNALDLVVLSTVSRMVVEDYLVGERFGEAARPILETSQRLETNAWELVRSVLKQEQQQELRALIDEWRRKNPTRRYVGAVRFSEFAESIGRKPHAGMLKGNSVLGLLFLDPMAGLDPALKAVEETRYLAERTLYYGQRLPVLLSWHAEYLALQLADQPAARQILTNAGQLTASLEVFAKTAEQLPRLVHQEREAAIQQVFAGVATERSNLLASLTSQEVKTRALLAEARTTLDSASGMATSVNTAVQSLESFVRYVSPPKTNLVSEPTKTNSRPFDILDYGTAAGQIGGMARDINALLGSVNQSTPQAAELGRQTAAGFESAIRRGFWLGLVLIVVFLMGSVLAAVLYQVLRRKLLARDSAPKGALEDEGLDSPSATLGLLLPFLAGLAFVMSGCGTPIGADKTIPSASYRQTHDNPVGHGRPSRETKSALHRFQQFEEFEKNPDRAISVIQQKAVETRDRDLLFVLSELSYLAGEKLRKNVKPWEPRDARDYYLASAVYAWLYLFGEEAGAPPGAFDHRFRTACELYNFGLGWALRERRSEEPTAILESGQRGLPGGGQLEIDFQQTKFPWPVSGFDQFVVADAFLVRGLSVRNRQAGVGAPLVAVSKPNEVTKLPRSVPATVVLRFMGGLGDVARGRARASLELYSAYDASTFKVGEQIIPLETDTTVSTAYSLNQAWIWKLGMLQFLSGEERVPTDVYLTQPYRRDKIPVVLVHGTFSSPVWWAEMANVLSADPVVRQRFQFWFFIYNSGNPIVYSAERLRSALQKKLGELDPDGDDLALRQMVVIGHSQGGLLTKLTATDTGDKLLEAVLKTNRLEDLKLRADEVETIRRLTSYDALPFVKRVVFISTPHRGSYVAGSLARSLARRFVSLPGRVVTRASELAGLRDKLNLPKELKTAPTSLDGMSPRNPFLRALAEIPIASGVKGHSIIAVQGDGDFNLGRDGLVTYDSAHVDYVESELVVRSFHSCQDKPATIEEVRRILQEHLQGAPTNQVARVPSP